MARRALRAACAPTLLAALVLLAVPAARAAEVRLNEVSFDARGVEIPFVASERAPVGATLSADVRSDGARTRIAFAWKKARPALLFGGNVTSYVAWTVTRDGVVERLGELDVLEPKGEATFSTTRKTFGLLVTAEPYGAVRLPSDVVVWKGSAPDAGRAPSTPFPLALPPGAAKPARASLGELEWTSREPAALVKARALVALAEEAKGGAELRALPDARAALARAESAWVREGAKAPADDARQASFLASEALREADDRKAAAEAARLESEKKAKEAAERARAEDETERRLQAEATLAEVEELRQQALRDREQVRLAHASLAAATAQVEAERLALAAKEEDLAKAKEAVAGRLAEALSKVAPTEPTSRGLVVVIPGTIFEAGKASLSAAGKATVAKLAGILLMVPEENVRVEGHSEAAKNPAAAAKLSEDRARNVADLLREHGLPGERIAFAGYGADRPVAPSTTAAGKAANRRLEVVVAEGTIPPPPDPEPAAPPAAP